MPPKHTPLLESPSGDGLDDLFEEYQDGQWVVVNLASLESIPLSDYSHTPYGQDSAYLDTVSMSTFHAVPNGRPSAMRVRDGASAGDNSLISPLPSPRSRNKKKANARLPAPDSVPSGSLHPSNGTSRSATLPSALRKGLLQSPPAERNDKESSRVLAALVRSELAKQLSPRDAGSSPDRERTDSPGRGASEPLPARGKAVVSPRPSRHRISLDAPPPPTHSPPREAANVPSPKAVAEAATKLYQNGATAKPRDQGNGARNGNTKTNPSQRSHDARSSPEEKSKPSTPPRHRQPRMPVSPPRPAPVRHRPHAQPLAVSPPPKKPTAEMEVTSPVAAVSLRDLTNARKVPVSGSDDNGAGPGTDHSPASSALNSSWSELTEDGVAKPSHPSRRSRLPLRETPDPEISSGRGPVRLAEFSPIPSTGRGDGSARDHTVNSDGVTPHSTTSRPSRHTSSAGRPPLTPAQTAPYRSSGYMGSTTMPSVSAATAAPTPTHSAVRHNSGSHSTSNSLHKPVAPATRNVRGAGLPLPTERRARSNSRRNPLCVPPPAPSAYASLEASKADLSTPPTTMRTAKERAAFASQEHLIAFVQAVSDPEVLHVIYDYLTEKRDTGNRYREAARICKQLLQQKEELLEGSNVGLLAGSRSKRQRGKPVPNTRRINRAIVDGDDDAAAGRATTTTAIAHSTAAARGLDLDWDDEADEEDEECADEFGDLNFTDTPYPEVHSKFQFGEPTVMGTVSRVFKEGLLFRIKDYRGDYYFYNDTLNQVMMVRAQCVLQGTERINERALVLPVEGSGQAKEITIAVLPEETNFFMGNCDRLPRIKAKAVVTPTDFTSPSVTKFMTDMNAEINKVRAALGQWSKATDQKAYLKCCLKNKLKFTDLEFRPCAQSLYRPGVDLVQIPPLTWRRPEEYLAFTEVSEARLFRGEISCHLVKQGELRDHTVVAAMAAIAQFPHHVMWMFRHPTSGEMGRRERLVGCYRATILTDGWWTNYVVDDYVPASAKGALFAHCPADPRRLWVSILEKVYAKATGSYSALCLVDVLDAVADFTGFPTRQLDALWEQAKMQPREQPSAALFRYLQRCMANGYVCLVYTPAANDAEAAATLDLSRRRSQQRMIPVDGVVPQFLPGHVYFLCDAAHYKELDLRMVRLKNPWTWETANSNTTSPTSALTAQRLWKYSGWFQRPDQSFASSLSAASTGAAVGRGTNAVRALEAKAFDEEEERKGTMWLEWTEALTAFAGGGVCYTLWHHRHYRVLNGFTTGFPDFVLEISAVKSKVELFLSMTMPSPTEEDVAAATEKSKHSNASGAGEGGVMDRLTLQQESRCGVALTVSKRARKMGRSSQGSASGDEEEICSMACDDVECSAGTTTYIKAKTVSMKVNLEASGAPYHVIPRIDPEDAAALRKRGRSHVPFVIGVLSSIPVGEPGGVHIRFKLIPRTCQVFTSDDKRFTINEAACAPVTTAYQCCHDGGVSTLEGEALIP